MVEVASLYSTIFEVNLEAFLEKSRQAIWCLGVASLSLYLPIQYFSWWFISYLFNIVFRVFVFKLKFLNGNRLNCKGAVGWGPLSDLPDNAKRSLANNLNYLELFFERPCCWLWVWLLLRVVLNYLFPGIKGAAWVLLLWVLSSKSKVVWGQKWRIL